METAIPLKDVFTITEYGDASKSKKQFTRIGIGFVNRDGSINVILDALPTNGRIHLRDRTPKNNNPKQGENHASH